HISQASGSGTNEGTCIIQGVPDVPTDECDEEISWKSSDEDDDDEADGRNTDNDGDDFVHPKLSIHKEEAKDEESFDLIIQTPKNSDDEGNDDASLGINVSGEEGQNAEDDDEELYRDVNINLDGRDSSSVSSQFVTSMLNLSLDAGINSLFESTPRDLLNFGCLFRFDHHLKTLEANFSELLQTNQFAGAVSFIPKIVERYMDQQMNEAVKILVPSTIRSWRFLLLLKPFKMLKILCDRLACSLLMRFRPLSRLTSAFLMIRIKVDTLTTELLAGLTYELMKGSCKSLVEVEFFREKVYKATTDQLDWNNPEGQQYPYNLLKPLPLIPNSQGRRVIPFGHFINNDLEYLRG
nr:hypothetical protein [Tanacetum cinerariifolium]